MLSPEEKFLLKVKYDLYFKSGFIKGFLNYHLRFTATLSILGFVMLVARESLTDKSMEGFLIFFALLASLVSFAHISQFLAANYCGKIGKSLVKPF